MFISGYSNTSVVLSIADTLGSSWHTPVLNMLNLWIYRASKSAIVTQGS